MKGSYTYSLAGTVFGQTSGNGLYQEAGTFVADGSGHITGGFDDFMQGSLTSTSLTGSYQIAADGTGTLSLTVGSRQLQWVITIASPLQLYMIEFDAFGCGGGGARPQNGSAFSAAPSGDYGFRVHNITPSGSVAKVGDMTLSGRSLAGSEDVLRGGVLSSPTILGTVTSPDTNGRGTLTFTENTGITATYLYYVIDANTLNFLQIDTNSLGEGRAELRSGGSFSNASLSNGFVFHSGGDTALNIDGTNSVGAFVSDGNGNITGGSYDSAVNGVPTANAALTGSYSVDSHGRATITLNPQGLNPIQEIAWIVDSSHGFFLTDATDRVEDGRFDQQQSASFSASSVNGQFGFYMSGYDAQTPSLVGRIGVFAFDGQTTLTFNDYYVNRTGLLTQKGGIGGTYTVSANGRVAASVPGVTKTLVLYLISDNLGYLMVLDAGAEEPGRMEQP